MVEVVNNDTSLQVREIGSLDINWGVILDYFL
jgi:hypothetical protein